jgi:hypothetical protein
MMAKSISRGMIAALLFMCAAPLANAGERDYEYTVKTEYEFDRGTYTRKSIHYYYPSSTTHVVVLGNRYRDRYWGRDGMKLIEVHGRTNGEPNATSSSCAMESGVCIIRGDRM